MRISDIGIFPLELPFRTPFLLSRGYVGAPGRPGTHIYLRLTTKHGQVGWGESRPMPTWSYETMESVYTTLSKHIGPILLSNDCSSIRALLRKIDSALTPSISTSHPFAISAVEQALFDLQGKESGMPLHRMLGGRLVDEVELCHMISGDAESVAEEATDMVRGGFRCFKIKISGDPSKDARVLGELSEAASEAQIWADANQAYNTVTFRALLSNIRRLPNIVCIEQPVPTQDYLGLRRTVEKSPVPIAVDESVFTHFDLMKLVTMEASDLVVLKVAKSGIIGTQKIAAVAESAGMPILGSGMTESGVGFAASIGVFSTLPVLLPVDTNGPQFLSSLLVKGLSISGSRVKVPNRPGLGIEVDEEEVKAHATEIAL